MNEANAERDESASAGTGAAEQALGVSDLRVRVPPEVRDVSFPIGVRGYERKAVDAYVGRVNRVIAELEVTRSPQAAVRHAVERVSEQTKAILEQARDSAEQINVTANEEAAQIRAAASGEAADLLVNANAEADRLKTEGTQAVERARAEAAELVRQAREEAEKIVTTARRDADELRRQTHEEISDERNRADARLREVQADAESAWAERAALLDDIESLAERLHRAAAEAASRLAPPASAPDADASRDDHELAPIDPEAETFIATPESAGERASH